MMFLLWNWFVQDLDIILTTEKKKNPTLQILLKSMTGFAGGMLT